MTFDYEIDLGAAGTHTFEIDIDLMDHMTSRDLAEYVEVGDALDYHGSEDFLQYITFDDIAEFCMNTPEVLERVIKALEDKYADAE